MNKIRAQIKIPNDRSYLAVVQHFVEQVAALAAMPATEAHDLNLAIDEAFMQVLHRGFESGAAADVTLLFECVSGEARITLNDSGRPFASPQTGDPLLDLGLDAEEKGLGTAIMQAMCDEVQVHRVGHREWETVLIKRFASPELAAEATATAGPGSGSVPSDFEIRPLRPEEAVEVSRLAFLAYGDTYFHPYIYFPDQINQLIERGRLHSWMAVTPTGEIAGHTALVMASPTAAVAEIAVAITKPAYRGHGCLDALATGVLTAAAERGLKMVYATAVTSHPYSQQAARTHGLRECALLVAAAPAARFRAIQESERQRETFMLMVLPLTKPRQTIIHAPATHARMVRQLCDWLGYEYASPTGTAAPIGERTIIHTIVEHDYHAAVMTLDSYGMDFSETLHAQLRRLMAHEIEPVYLSLPLDDPATATLAGEAETLGFFFSGIAPIDSGDIHLRLIHLGSIVYDYSNLRVASDEGRALLGYVQAHDPVQKSRKAAIPGQKYNIKKQPLALRP
jgi:anti-sigma regulatory factor (Ser/Thr protein kinase)